MPDKIIAVVGATGAQGGGLVRAILNDKNGQYAVRALNEGLRLDLLGTGVRVATIDPGMVASTEFSLVRFHGDAERAAAVYRGVTPLRPEDVAELVVFVATRPPHVNVAETVILPTDQASATNVHRRSEPA